MFQLWNHAISPSWLHARNINKLNIILGSAVLLKCDSLIYVYYLTINDAVQILLESSCYINLHTICKRTTTYFYIRNITYFVFSHLFFFRSIYSNRK